MEIIIHAGEKDFVHDFDATKDVLPRVGDFILLPEEEKSVKVDYINFVYGYTEHGDIRVRMSGVDIHTIPC